MGVPEGIMPISKFQVGHFGIHAFEVLNAVNLDFFVMCLYGNNVTAQDVFTVNRSIPIEYFSRKQSDGEAVQRYLSGTDAEYYAACLPVHVLQQYGEIRHESKNAAVSYET